MFSLPKKLGGLCVCWWNRRALETKKRPQSGAANPSTGFPPAVGGHILSAGSSDNLCRDSDGMIAQKRQSIGSSALIRRCLLGDPDQSSSGWRTRSFGPIFARLRKSYPAAYPRTCDTLSLARPSSLIRSPADTHLLPWFRPAFRPRQILLPGHRAVIPPSLRFALLLDLRAALRSRGPVDIDTPDACEAEGLSQLEHQSKFLRHAGGLMSYGPENTQCRASQQDKATLEGSSIYCLATASRRQSPARSRSI